MTEQLYITEHLRQAADRDGSPQAKLAVTTVEMLTRLILQGKVEECADLTDGLLKVPGAAHTVIAMAIGCIAQAELNLRGARKTLSGMVDEAPDTLGALKQQIFDEAGLSTEDRERISKQMDEAIKKGL